MKKAMGYVSLLVLVATPALAQERHRVGLNFLVGGSTSAIGTTWHVTDRLALRPSLSYAWNRYLYRQDFSPVGEIDEHERTASLGAGLGALLYLRQRESLSTYVTAELALTRTSLRMDGTDPSWTRSGARASGAFGVQYAFTKHVSAFGETGLEYATQPVPVTGDMGKRFGTLRTGVGATFYLN